MTTIYPSRSLVVAPRRQAGVERWPVWNRLPQAGVTLTDPNSIIQAGWAIDGGGFLTFTTHATNVGEHSGATRTGATWTVQVPVAIDHQREFIVLWLHIVTLPTGAPAIHRIMTYLGNTTGGAAIYQGYGLYVNGANRPVSGVSSSAALYNPAGLNCNFVTDAYVTHVCMGGLASARLRELVARWYQDPTVGVISPTGIVDIEDRQTTAAIQTDQPVVGIGVSNPNAGAWSGRAALYWAIMQKHPDFAVN